MIIYTASFGSYDDLLLSADVRYDESHNPYSGTSREMSPRLMAKMYKVLNPESFDVWIDSNIEILDKDEFYKLFKGDISVFRHPFNKTVGEELALCRTLGHLNDTEFLKIEELYIKKGLDVYKEPLYACGVLFRSQRAKRFNDIWWKLISMYSFRDQLTFPCAVRMNPQLELNVIDLNIYENRILKIQPHK